MLKKLIENWWTNANERTFQYPFAFHLVVDGHAVLHVSRHCGMELGKDILSIDRDGLIHSFQLKGCNGGKLSLKYWRRELSAQVEDLVLNPVVHSSLPDGKSIVHQAWLVVNGELEEELIHAINGRNETFERLHGRRLNVITLGQLIAKSIEIESEFWPPNPEHSRDIFEAYLDDGRRVLNKERLSRVLQGMVASAESDLSETQLIRLSHSMMLLTSLLTKAHSREANWVAQIEAWVICWSICQSAWVRKGLEKKISASRVRDFVISIVEVLLRALKDECVENPDLHSSKGHFDIAYDMTPIKSGWILGLLSVYALKCRETGLADDETEILIEKIASAKHTRPRVWGEASIPQLLALHFLERCRNATMKSEGVLVDLMHCILVANSSRCEAPFPSPYIDADTYLASVHSDDKDKITDMVSDQHSYWLEPIVDMLASQMYRQTIACNWDLISRIRVEEFEPTAPADFLLWKCEEGTNRSRNWPTAQSWSELRSQATLIDLRKVPAVLTDLAWLTLLFLIVFPHRKERNLIHWLDQRVWSLATESPRCQ